MVWIFEVPERPVGKDGQGAAVDVHAFVDRTWGIKIGCTAQIGAGASAERSRFKGQVHAGDGTSVVHVNFNSVVLTTIGRADDDRGSDAHSRKRLRERQGCRRCGCPWHRGHEEDQEQRR